MLNWLEDWIHEDLLSTDIKETTSTFNKTTNESTINQFEEQTIENGAISKIENNTRESNIRPLSEINLSNNIVNEQLNSVKDLIIFNDHQYTKNTNYTNETSTSTITNLPPLSIEEALNDQRIVQDFNDQDLTQISSTNCSIQSPAYYSIESSNENLLNDDYFDQFSFDQSAAASVTFDF